MRRTIMPVTRCVYPGRQRPLALAPRRRDRRASVAPVDRAIDAASRLVVERDAVALAARLHLLAIGLRQHERSASARRRCRRRCTTPTPRSAACGRCSDACASTLLRDRLRLVEVAAVVRLVRLVHHRVELRASRGVRPARRRADPGRLGRRSRRCDPAAPSLGGCSRGDADRRRAVLDSASIGPARRPASVAVAAACAAGTSPAPGGERTSTNRYTPSPRTRRTAAVTREHGHDSTSHGEAPAASRRADRRPCALASRRLRSRSCQLGSTSTSALRIVASDEALRRACRWPSRSPHPAGCGDNSKMCGPGTDGHQRRRPLRAERVPDGRCAATARSSIRRPSSCVIDPAACQNGTVLDQRRVRRSDGGPRRRSRGGPRAERRSASAARVERARRRRSRSSRSARGVRRPRQHQPVPRRRRRRRDRSRHRHLPRHRRRADAARRHASTASTASPPGSSSIPRRATRPLASWHRFGLNLTGDTSRRQLFLPAAGTYVHRVADTRSLFLDGGAARRRRGGRRPDGDYFVSIDRAADARADRADGHRRHRDEHRHDRRRRGQVLHRAAWASASTRSRSTSPRPRRAVDRRRSATTPSRPTRPSAIDVFGDAARPRQRSAASRRRHGA